MIPPYQAVKQSQPEQSPMNHRKIVISPDNNKVLSPFSPNRVAKPEQLKIEVEAPILNNKIGSFPNDSPESTELSHRELFPSKKDSSSVRQDHFNDSGQSDTNNISIDADDVHDRCRGPGTIEETSESALEPALSISKKNLESMVKATIGGTMEVPMTKVQGINDGDILALRKEADILIRNEEEVSWGNSAYVSDDDYLTIYSIS